MKNDLTNILATITKKEAHQLVGTCETLCHPTFKSLLTFSISLVVILRHAELFHYTAWNSFFTFMQYSITLCNLPKHAGGVVYGTNLEDVGQVVLEKCVTVLGQNVLKKFVPLTLE